jgi:hypothetical protein
VIVFASKVGVAVNGAADYVSGTHVWFPSNQAIRFFPFGVMAFHVTDGQNRFDGCYIDGSRAVFEGSGLSGNICEQPTSTQLAPARALPHLLRNLAQTNHSTPAGTNGFECCAGYAGAHGIELIGNAIGPGLTITNNLFRGGNIYSTNTSAGPVVVRGTQIASNSFTGGGGGSRAALALTQTAATQWAFDFCDALIFPTIARVSSITVSTASGFPVAVARPPVGCTLLVETSVAVTGTVSVEVDSSSIDKDYV